MNNEDSTRFRIIYALMKADEPKSLTELKNELSMDKELVYHHLKNLKNELLIAEVDKRYMLQDFFYDENVMDILNSQMKTIVLTILRELKNTDYTEDELETAVRNNLEIFIQTFSVEIS